MSKGGLLRSGSFIKQNMFENMTFLKNFSNICPLYILSRAFTLDIYYWNGFLCMHLYSGSIVNRQGNWIRWNGRD